MSLRFLTLILLILLLAAMSGGAAAFHFYGVPGLLLAFLGVLVVIWLLKSIALRVASMVFLRDLHEQADVLRHASAEIHSVTPTVAPSYDDEESYEDFDEDEELDSDLTNDSEREYSGPYNWYYVDVTITPRPDQPLVEGEPPEWSPSELVLVPTHHSEATTPFSFLGWCELGDFEIWDGAGWEMGRDDLVGPRRVRLHVGLKPDISEWRLCYWTEVFGDVIFVED